LTHEWEHIRRGDLWYLGLCRWLTVILFANPLYWWLRSQLHRDQELLADAAVTHMSPLDYAELLVSWSRNRGRQLFVGHVALAGQALTFGGGELKRRVTQLLDPNKHIELSPPISWTRCLNFLLIAAIASLSAISISEMKPLRDLITVHASDSNEVAPSSAANSVEAITAAIENSHEQTGIAEAGIAETGIAETGIAETGIAETGIAETGIAETGIAETGIAETGIAETGEKTAAKPRVVLALSEHTSLELLAMRLHPCDGESWWQLDGTAIGRESKIAVETSIPTHYFPPEVVIRITTSNGVTPEWAPDPRFARKLEQHEVAVDDASGGNLYAISLPVDSTDFELKLTRGEWKVRSVSTCSAYFDNDPFQYSPCNETDKLIVSVRHPVHYEQLRLVAMDNDGREHRPVETSDDGGELTAVFSHLAYDDAQSFYVQSRPQLSVDLHNLPLSPGQQTDFQVVARNGHDRAHQESEL
jgi:hypothetical protein